VPRVPEVLGWPVSGEEMNISGDDRVRSRAGC
jgi:hypothetical protein